MNYNYTIYFCYLFGWLGIFFGNVIMAAALIYAEVGSIVGGTTYPGAATRWAAIGSAFLLTAIAWFVAAIASRK